MENSESNNPHVIEIENVEFKPALSGLIASVEVCTSKSGLDLSPPVLAGLFGHAFESSYGLGGAELWPACAMEWSHFGGGLGRLGVLRRKITILGNVEPIPSNEEWNRVLEKGRQAAQVTLLKGVPILGWQLLRVRAKSSSRGNA